MTLFAKKVYQVIQKIPEGKVATYAAVARAIGHGNAYRAVGTALNRNPMAPQVPCHRIVCSDGRVSGYASGQQKKIKRLRKEGVMISKNRIDLKRFGWRFSHFG